MIDRVYMTT